MNPDTLDTLARAAMEAAAERRANGVSGEGPDSFDKETADEYEAAAEAAALEAARARLGPFVRAVEYKPGHWRALYSTGPGRVMRTVKNEDGREIVYMTERAAMEAAAHARKEFLAR